MIHYCDHPFEYICDDCMLPINHENPFYKIKTVVIHYK